MARLTQLALRGRRLGRPPPAPSPPQDCRGLKQTSLCEVNLTSLPGVPGTHSGPLGQGCLLVSGGCGCHSVLPQKRSRGWLPGSVLSRLSLSRRLGRRSQDRVWQPQSPPGTARAGRHGDRRGDRAGSVSPRHALRPRSPPEPPLHCRRKTRQALGAGRPSPLGLPAAYIQRPDGGARPEARPISAGAAAPV